MRNPSAWRVALATAALIGAAFSAMTASATTLQPLAATDNQTTHVVTIGVSVLGSAPTGYVIFYEGYASDPSIGVASISNGVASLALADFPMGAHTITVHYFGDPTNGPTSLTFIINVAGLGWVPAVFDPLLSD